jgi:ribonuclease HI
VTNTLITRLDELRSLLTACPALPPALEREIAASIDRIVETLTAHPHCQQSLSPIHIWTDGACAGNPGPGGWGTIISTDGACREYSGFDACTTNNIMELTAALEGLRRTPRNTSIILTSDSQYLVKGMSEWLPGWKRRNWRKADGTPVLNADLWRALDDVSAQRQVTWKWIRGHSGHAKNERCDRLARSAIEEGLNP